MDSDRNKVINNIRRIIYSTQYILYRKDDNYIIKMCLHIYNTDIYWTLSVNIYYTDLYLKKRCFCKLRTFPFFLINSMTSKSHR